MYLQLLVKLIHNLNKPFVRNSYTPSPLRYALTKKIRLEVELLCSCSLTSKVVQNK
jgi:hypothetical protein